MKIIGVLLILFGFFDIFGSYADFDIWGEWIGITLPELVWIYSGWLEIILGCILYGSMKPDDSSQ